MKPKVTLAGLCFLCACEGNAWAHDCSSASDCEEVVRNQAWVAAALALGLAWLAKQKIKLKPVFPPERSFKAKDCAAAQAKLAELVEQKKEAGATRPELKTTARWTTTQNSDGSWTSKGTMSAELDLNKTVVELPTWTDLDRGNAPVVKAWDDALAALTAHEMGHVAVAEEVARQFGKQSVSGTGKTREEAEAAAAQSAKAKESALKDELDARGKEYNDRTEGGVKQTNVDPKAKNAVLNCP